MGEKTPKHHEEAISQTGNVDYSLGKIYPINHTHTHTNICEGKGR